MAIKRHKPEEIVAKLRQVGEAFANRVDKSACVAVDGSHHRQRNVRYWL